MEQLNGWETLKKVNNLVNSLCCLAYGGGKYYLLTIHKVQEHNEKIKFRYNSTYNIFGIFYGDYVYLYYNEHKNIQKTKDLKNVLELLNKEDAVFERTYQEIFDKQLKTYFDNKQLMKSIKEEIEVLIVLTYQKQEKFFKEKLNDFITNKVPQIIEGKSGIVKIQDQDDGVLYLDKNGVTIKATDKAVPGIMYYFQGEQYYVAIDKFDITKKIFKDGFSASKIVTTYVTNFDFLFKGKTRFNQDITSWDTSNVTSMNNFLHDCRNFNQNIFEYYDTSKVTDMSYMLCSCWKFSYPLTNLDTSNVTNFKYFMSFCYDFNHPISHLNVEKGENFDSIFTRFKESPMSKKNQSIKGWKPKSATSIRDIFSWSPELQLEAYYIFKEYSKNLSEDNLNKEFGYLFENRHFSYLFNK